MREQLPLTYWIPTAFKIGYVEQSGISHRKSMVLLANNTEIARVLDRICHNFDKLWQRKAFANWYLNEGMSEEQINALRASAQELIQSYQVAEESGAKAKVQDSSADIPRGGSSHDDSRSGMSLRDLVDRRRA